MTDSTGDSVTRQTRPPQLEHEGQRELFAAAALGQDAVLERRLRADPALVHARAADGQTPLHVAAQWGQLEAAQRLMASGADAGAADLEGRTPLHRMTGNATRLALLDLLLRHGANPDAADHHGNTPLFLAASQIHRVDFEWADHAGLATALLERGATLDAFSATILGRTDELRALLAADRAPLTARKRHGYIPDGSTLLHFAADRGQVAATGVLLDLGADVSAVDSRGRPALYLAAHDQGTRKPGPSREVVEQLLAAGAPLDVFAATLLGRLDDLARLVGAAPALSAARDAGGNSALHLAAWNGQAEAAGWLLEQGAEVDPANARGETPLSLAAGYGHAPIVELLLNRGARPSVFTAIQLGRPDRLRLALEADPAAAVRANRYGRTPMQMLAEALMWAHTLGNTELEARHIESLQRLQAAGAPLEIGPAAALGEVEAVARLLAEQPARVNQADNGNTPLHLAAALGHAGLVEMLVARGAALEARDYAGCTPLRRAAGFIPGTGHGDAATVEVLLRQGANPDARNNWDDTPFAVSLSTPAVAEVLLRHGLELNVWAAAALGRTEALRRLLAAQPESLTAIGPFGFQPVNWAVVNGQTASAAYLLDQGAPLTTEAWGRSLLSWATQCGQPATAEMLRERGLRE